MAYNTQEERLKVQGSEQVTRDLKVNGNIYAGELTSNGDLDVHGEIIARDDVSISGDLYVNGTEHINDTETSQTSDNYMVLRHNKSTALGANEHAGIAVHNYSLNKTATCTVDSQGTWRVADNTEASTVYTNKSYFNGIYYNGLTRTTATITSGIKSAWDEDELDECVYYTNSYYHFDGSDWYAVALTSNALTVGTKVTDSATITALNALTKYDLVYYRSLTVTVINEIENEPLLTRDEASNLQNKDIFMWDSTAKKAVAISRPASNNLVLTSKSTGYSWESSGSGAVAHFANMAAYNTAKLIPEGSDGYIPDNAIVIIDNETDYIMGETR